MTSKNIIPPIEGCISYKIYVKGPKKYGRDVCHQLIFKVDGTFESMYAADRWLSANGFSRGTSCGIFPSGILKGDYNIAKWKNLTNEEKRNFDGIMEGDFRDGPVTISIFYSKT